MILPIVQQIMPQLKKYFRCCEEHLMGLIFFDLFSHSGLRAFFTSDFANCTTNYAPTIRCCPQHLMVGVIFFFLTCSPILDLGHFSQVILPIVLLIMPQLSGAVHSIWFLEVFYYLFSHSGLSAFFTSDFANCTTNYAPTIRCCSQHLMVGVFFLPVLPFWTEGIFHRWFCQLYYSLCPTIRCCSQHLMVGVNFFWPVLPFWT